MRTGRLPILMVGFSLMFLAGLGACGPDGTGAPSGWGNGASGSETTGSSGNFSSGSDASAMGHAGTGISSGSAASGASGNTSSSGTSGSSGRGRPDAGATDGGGAPESGPPCTPKGGALTGCAATVPTAIFAKNCAAAGCHNPAGDPTHYAASGLDLTSPGVALRIYNVTASENLPTSNFKLIDSQTPETSYLLLKVKMSMPPIGSQMPSMGVKLTTQQQQCLHDWVVAEAAGCGRL